MVYLKEVSLVHYFFIIYINDIENCYVNRMFRVFADDTGIFVQSSDENVLIEKA